MAYTTRTIIVSTEVFAAIWAHRQPGEDDENAILHRQLGCKDNSGEAGANIIHNPLSQVPPSPTPIDGVFDRRNDVHFQQGTEILRAYKGHTYKAMADDGMWTRLDTGKKYLSLNQLNLSITNSTAENVWGKWEYLDNGRYQPIDNLRSSTNWIDRLRLA